MSKFICKLALERCQQNIAQITALSATGQGTQSAIGQKTLYALIESLNRDLSLLEDGIDQGIDEAFE